MHQYLVKTFGLLAIFFSYLLWGLLSVAYLSIDNKPASSGSLQVLNIADQKLIIHEDGVPQAPLVSSWIKLFSELNSSSPYDFLHSALGQVLFYDYTLHLKLVKNFYESAYTKSISIYLLNCAFLI